MYTKTSLDCDFNNDQLIRRTSQNKSAKSLQCNDASSNQEDEESKDASKTTLQMLPSDYVKQITASPENILCKDVDCNKVESSVFTTKPKIVIFPRFEIGNYYNVMLQIRNTSKVPHQLRLQDSNDLHFNIRFKGLVLNTRLAPGMTHAYEVEFHPDEIRHYFHKIIFKTDMGMFTVPILAVGPRAILAFPDQIDMGQTAVKVAKTKPILMQNIGDVFTAFSIFTDNSNFSVTPSKGTIRFDEAIQIQVTFNPKKIGIINGHIILRYESGDKVQSIIYGEAIKCDVRVVEQDIKVENTYFGLSRLATIQIENNSDYLLPYQLVKFRSIEEDAEERERWKESIPRREFLQSDSLLPNVRKLICNRVHADEVDSIDDVTFTCSDKHFDIFPICGEAWPRNSTNVTITFEPKTVGDISSTLYLDIAGLENRIAISLRGKCVGPALELNILSLDIQEVYLCSTYKYEVVCRNVGPIAGTIKYKQNNSNFGSMITIEPAQLKIDEGHLKSMVLSFYSGQTGTFVERVDFFIEESSEILSFIMKGTVICPLVRNEEGKVELGPASIGFTMRKQLSFRNLSHAPIEFSINIPLDGYEDVITHEEFAKAHSKPKLSSCPREFNVCPCNGTISPLSSICVQLAYTPNIVRSGEINLQVELCNCTGNPLLVPISFDAKTPRFNITPAEVKIRFCFINFPYSKKIWVTNNSEVDGYFFILPQKTSSRSPILYSLCTYQGYLNAGQSKEIQLTVIVKEIGEQRINLSILSLGFFEPVSCLEIICVGQGPVISVEPTHLNWAEVTLLQTVCLSLNIFNDSPIPAEFSVTLSKSQPVWNVEPQTGELSANESSTLKVSILLKDAGKYADRLLIKIYNGKTIIVNLSAVGVGTCIIFEPEIFPLFDMGFLFSHQNIKIPLTVKNKGNRHHHIILSHVEKVKQGKKGAITEESEDGKYKVDPNIIELLPGAEKTVHCKIRWDANEVVTEQWYVYANIEGQGKRELLGSSAFVATFIEPNITFDKNELTFRIDKGVGYEMFQQEDEICITNQSGRSLTAHFQLDAPFFIVYQCNCLTDNHVLVLHNNEPVYLKCHFSFNIKKTKLTPQKFNGILKITYEEHKQIDKILCVAQVNFPHLLIIPTEIYVYCVAGYITEENVKILNDGPLPVYYKISWIKESFQYKLLIPRSESRICEGTESKACLERDASPRDTLKCDESERSKEFTRSDNSSSTDAFREMCSIEICECGQTVTSSEQFCDGISNVPSWKFYGEAETQASSSTATILEGLSFIDKLLQIEPIEGHVLPCAEQNIKIIFNGFENIKLYIEAICEIEQGAAKILIIHATADSVRCEIRDYVLDFGLQLFSEPSVADLKIFNQCMIPLKYSIASSSSAIKITGAPEEFNFDCESTILVERQPSAPGIINETILIQVMHLEPFIIAVKCLSTIPQIYLDLTRGNEAFQKYPIEYGYEAVQLVAAESSIQEANYIESNCSDSNMSNMESFNQVDLSAYDLLHLTEENWEVIWNTEKYPSQVDIDMAFERLIIKHYIESNRLTRCISMYKGSDLASEKNLPDISFLMAPPYVIDMKYVVVNQAAQSIISLKNYGYEKAKIKLRKDDKKKKPNSKTLFHVQLEKKVEICQCESAHLSIIFYPKKNIFLDRRTDVSHKFFLEIKQGLTVPITVKAAAVYPFVTVNTRLLNFDKVYTGQCREMKFILKNQGFVDCQWDISIENVSKNQLNFTENPFYVNYTKDICEPGYETAIKVYFRPYKNGNHKRNLSITVQNGQENEIIRLIGYGVERKLNIDKTNITFQPIIPKVNIMEEKLTIKNVNSCPVEIYWQHLEDFSETNRIIRVLKHYYKSEEILIPERKIGESIPGKLIEFYNKLVRQMFQDPHFRSYLDDMFLINHSAADNYSQDATLDLTKEKNNERSLFDFYQYSVKADDNLSILFDDIPQVDEKEVEALLHVYLDKLQENPNVFNIMYDPLDEIYHRDISEIKENARRENDKVKKNLIIIFHGAPYTEYQETACRSAKALKLPVLNLNKIFIEALAYSSNEHVKVLAEQLDRRYRELAELLEKMVSQQGKKVAEKTDATQIFYLLSKLPPAEQVEMMDTYSQYEHKFEMICLITNLLESKAVTMSKFKDKSSIKGQDSDRKASILPAIEQDLFKEILRESLSQLKFKRGYVLQTLNNEFIRNEAIALSTLLEATGNVDTYLFITFHNSFEQFQIRACHLSRKKEEEDQEEIEEMLKQYQDMTESEYDLLPEDEKIRCNELKVKKNRYRATESTQLTCEEEYVNPKMKGLEAISDKSDKLSKIEKLKKYPKDSIISKESGKSNLISTKNSCPKSSEIPKEIQKAMKEYETSVDALLEAIIDWEAGLHYRESIRPLKNSKGKIRSSITFQPKVVTVYYKNCELSPPLNGLVINLVNLSQDTEKFFIFRVHAQDPWERNIYDSIVSLLPAGFKGLIQSRFEENETTLASMESRTYSILREYELLGKSTRFNDIFSISLETLENSLDHGSKATLLDNVTISACAFADKQQRNTTVKEWTSTPSLLLHGNRTTSSNQTNSLMQEAFPSRWTLQPDESRTFKLEFRPNEEGHFQEDLSLSFIDNPSNIYKINIEAIAQVAKLDMTPELLFDKVKDSQINESLESAYILDLQVYDFGNILVLRKTSKIHKKTTQMKFRNISLVTATVSLSLLNKNYNIFEVYPRNLEILPNEVGYIDITARTQTFGISRDDLIVSIKDNNQLENISLQCFGTELKISIEPKKLELGRVLLNRRERQVVTAQNLSAVTVYWHLSTEPMESQIKCYPESGKMKCNEIIQLEIAYLADKIAATAEIKTVALEIFLEERDTEPIATYVISIIAETYEIIDNLEPENLIDFKNIPVESFAKETFAIKNSGPHEFTYEINFQEFESLRAQYDQNTLVTLQRDLQVYPTSGSILPKKQTIINFTYKPSSEITLKSVPLFKYLIVEPYNNIGPVKEGFLNVSLAAYYTRFKIEPQTILNFGTLALKCTKILQINVENTGRFPLRYSFVNQTITQLTESSSLKRQSISLSKKDKKSSHQEKTTKRRSISIQNPIIKWGPFTMDKIHGELEPGKKDSLIIRCSSETVGQFEEKLVILVPDSFPNNKENNEISLIAEVCIATIDYQNYFEIFPDSYVVDSIEELSFLNKVEEYTIFSKRSSCLYFCKVCVGSSHSTSVTLRNISAVPAKIIIEIQNDLNNVFQINAEHLEIPSMSKTSFSLIFSPNFLGTFSGTLNMKLDVPHNVDTRPFSIGLEGEGHVPQIRILEPSQLNGSLFMTFGLMYLSEPREKVLKIQNIGEVVTNVIIDINDDDNEVYGLLLDREKMSLPCNCPTTNKEAHIAVFRIIPNETVDVTVQFVPIKVGKFSSQLKVSIEGNPYEITEVTLTGEGFVKPIVLYNLEIVDPSCIEINGRTESRGSIGKPRKYTTKNTSLSRSTSKILNQVSVSYALDYGRCYLNRMSKINFTMVNKTQERYYRFEWASNSNVVCTPSVGHLAPNNFKEMTATFLTTEPISLSKVPWQCQIYQIILNEPSVEPSWDNRQTEVSWLEKIPSSEFGKEVYVEEDIYVKKEIIKSKEPGYRVVVDSEETIELLISAIADYSDYQCNLESIKFDDTLMFENREFKFLLENIGVVQLDFIWSLTMDEHYPVRLDQSRYNSKSNVSCEYSTGTDDRSKNSAMQNRNSTGNNDQSSRAEIHSSKRRFHATSRDTEESKETSDLFSNSAGLTDRSTDSWMEGENWPFEMSPEKGSLLPGQSIQCTLKFSPVDVFQYKAYLQCKIENLNPTKEPLRITVCAKSLLPYCHFEMEKTDYLTANRRDAKLPVPQGYNLTDIKNQSKIRLTEFTLMGIGECHTRFIYLINPTTEDYTFSFTRITNGLFEKQAALQCLTEIGEAKRGSKTAIKFAFVPESVGLIETYWLFQIKKYNLESLFLIVVNTVEPSLTCRRLLLKLGPSPLGQMQHSSFEISNNESCQLKFSIKPDSLYSEGRFQTLVVYPLIGILCPNSTKDFHIEYEPSRIGEHNFNIECQVEKLNKPVKVFVTAQVLNLSAKLIYIESNGQEVNINENYDNLIDIDQLFLNEPMELKFKIINSGKLLFDYCWNLNLITNHNVFSLSTEDLNGRIDSNCQSNCYLQLLAVDKITSLKYPLTLKIMYGPTFRLKLNVSATTSPIEFNFNSYDFGPCYIQTHEGILYTVDLLVKNNNKIPCALLCNFDECPEIKVDLQYLVQAIPANTTARVPIYFEPLIETEYKKMLHFSIVNSSIKKKILVKGEGISYKIRLKNPCDAFIDFGTLLVGKSACRKIRLVNEGRLPVRLRVVVIEVSTEDLATSYCEKTNEGISKVNSWSNDDLESLIITRENFDIAKFVTVSPCGLRDLKPNKEMELTVQFKAAQRIKWLKAKFGIQMDCSCLPLTTAKAACSLANFCFNRAYISFGSVYEGCTVEEKFILINDGDIGSRFYWNTDQVKSYFDIKPMKGYSTAGSEIIFTCTFTPTCESSCTENKAFLILEEYANLKLTMSGNCLEIPEPTKSVDFTAEIRQSETKEIEIHNDSSVSWLLKPRILGEYFTAPTELTINPKSTLHLIIKYTPLKETILDHLHEGRLIVMLPDGKAPILYKLIGRCTAAVTWERLYRQIPAKKKYIETFTVYNSSDYRRTFDCKTELLDENKKNNANTAQINVPAKKQVQYQVVFYFESEGTYFYKVWFNDHREHVQNYDVEFTVTKPVIQDNIELNTYVRSCTFYTIKIENPLEREAVTFEATSSNEDIVVHGFPLSLPPLAFKNVQLEYLPLHPCDTSSELVLSSDLLGSLFYNLHLIAMPAPPEKTVHVQSSLGSETTFTLKLKNFSKVPCEFVLKLNDPSFTCTSPVPVAAKCSSQVEIKFEPRSLETIKSTVQATSDVAGEFVFPITAQGTMPQPRGPFLATPKAPALINFKNPFLRSKVFILTMDSTDFLLNNSKVTIASKKSYDVTVQLRKREKNKCEKRVKVGKLTVSCDDADASVDQVKWIYYIKGVMDSQV